MGGTFAWWFELPEPPPGPGVIVDRMSSPPLGFMVGVVSGPARFYQRRWWPEVERTATSTSGHVPLWISLVCVLLPTGFLWYRDRRHPPGTCAKCGYDLTGNTTGLCPECGEGETGNAEIAEANRGTQSKSGVQEPSSGASA